MEHSAYGIRIALSLPFETAVATVSEALKAEGFGVLTSIDVRQTLKTKLDRDFRPYVILGACHPALADRALHAELEIGLLLPCNVIVYETPGKRSVVAAMAPLVALGRGSPRAGRPGVPGASRTTSGGQRCGIWCAAASRSASRCS